MNICKKIRRAILDEGVVDVPPGIRPVQIQTWAHTIANRLGLRVKTTCLRSQLSDQRVIAIRQRSSGL